MTSSRLVAAFSNIRDPRVERTRLHRLTDILVIAVLAVINGSTAWSDMELFAISREAWLRKFLELRNGVPSEDTFRRVFEAIRPKEFDDAIAVILNELITELDGKGVAIDGKTMRGSRDKRKGRTALHVVSAWVTELGLSLGQVVVDEKSNEITAIPELLDTIDISGATITIDAMGCQKAIAEKIVDGGGEYILAVKDNHPKLHAALEIAFDDSSPCPLEKSAASENVTSNKGHGRIEKRRVRRSLDIEWIQGIEEWKEAKSIIEVERTRTIDQTTTVERVYYISSLAIDASSIGTRIRSHWGIENSLHWVLDVTYGEDKSRVRDRNSAANLTALRKLTIAMLKRAPKYKARSMAQQRKLAGWRPDYALEVLGAIIGD